MAKRFQFRLEVVLRVRQQQRDDCRRRFVDSLRHVQRQEHTLAALRGEIQSELLARRRDAGQATLDMGLLRSRRFYGGHLQQAVVHQETQLHGLQQELEHERGRLADASRELKVIEKLRDRQWNRHCTEAARRETREADELSIEQFRRRIDFDQSQRESLG